MASAKAKDPLDALQSLVNDVLIQTGKALRASRRDSHGNLPPTHMQAKLPDTISAFHSALDSLEHDIIRAKSVILRDINKLKKQKTSATEDSKNLPQPQPVEAQSKPAIVIDIDSPPQPTTQTMPREESKENSFVATKTAAPFPDMGMPAPAGTSISIKEEHLPSQSLSMTEASSSSKPKAEVKASTLATPVPMMDVKLESNASGLSGGRGVLDLAKSDLNFTDMEFTLAPGSVNPNQSGGTGAAAAAANPSGPVFDPGSFGSSNGAPATTSLNNGISSNIGGKAAARASGMRSMPAPAPAPALLENRRNTDVQKKEEGTSATFADVFTGDGQADGMDFDFSIGDGMGGDTFDDLMNDRDNTFDSMEHGDFDANFFGLDKAEGA
ncbi:hypothetical protein E4U42_006246 [Claviceps africana]|uniref:Uncharacterized protein n=1 Tax=Claviceps africana TaxID=83212 RepID=A0A8K0J3J7_9HYPO|nr:hypothetical protein E4U42_006246 [Claviceps africana]